MATLRDYQSFAVKRIEAAGGRFILADDVGLGKTVMALAFANRAKTDRYLIVCPASVTYKWQVACQDWCGQTVPVLPHGQGPAPAERAAILTWDSLSPSLEQLSRHRFDLIIFDEAHRLKNPQAQRTRAARTLALGVPYLLFLSATPMLNRREELWSPLSMIDPSAWGNFYQFKAAYCNDNRGAATWTVKTPDDLKAAQARAAERNRQALAKRLAPVYLRRTRLELGFKAPIVRPIPVQLAAPYADEYAHAKRDLIGYLQEQGLPTGGARLAKALVGLGVLRRIVGRGKLDTAAELAKALLEDDPARKLVIYALHADVVSRLAQTLDGYGVERIVGSVSAAERFQANLRFQAEAGPRIMLISEAGEEGIDLFRAAHLILAERGWNPKSDDQATGRIDRHGQTAEYVTVHKLIARGTVDVMIDRLIERKRTDVDGTIMTRLVLERLLEGDDQ